MTDAIPDNAVAIIGMAGRFPGAPNVDRFWQNILNGVESVTRLDASELEDNFDPATRGLPNFVPARSILEGVDLFDAPFFSMLPREAAMTDPQQRILLECAWEALEDAGYDPATSGSCIGVFAGATTGTYLLHHLFRDRASVAEFTSGFQVGNLPMLLGSAADFTATRIGYKLGLTGPCVAVQSACSTSLLAVAQAVQSLLCHGCDMALAGGVSITFPQRRGYLAQDGGMVSVDGHCRPFDSRADGTVFGSGAGLVLLKRLQDAVADRDHVYAVIRGVGVNNDGAAKVGFTAPSIDGQAAAIAMAHAAADIDARSVGYVECHGTGTQMGDPIEVAALTAAFRSTTDDLGFCALGSVKSNIGHLDVAAGVAGLIKATLAVSSGTIPASLHVNEPNPALDLPNSPFFVADRRRQWIAQDGPRRAGVSAFGVGGTNVHLVLEQAPAAVTQPSPSRKQILTVSARSAAALVEAKARLADHLQTNPGQDIADIAFTLQTGRRHFSHRAAVIGSERSQIIDALLKPVAVRSGSEPSNATSGDVVFMFPGQGAQHPQMARQIYEAEPVYRDAVNLCSEILAPKLGFDLRAKLYPEGGDGDIEGLTPTAVAQPAIFTVEYALAKLLMSWGVTPAAMIGHSVGEFAAACLAGVFSLEDALSLIALRGRLMQDLPGGAMLAVRLPQEEMAALARDGISIAAINAPGTGVLAGSYPAVEALEAVLAQRNVMHRRLATSHAFHSDMIDPLIAPFTSAVEAIRLHPPRLPYISGVTGQWVTAAQTTSAGYWARHAREPVRFADGIATLVKDLSPVFVEAGPGTALSNFARQGAGASRASIACLPSPDGDQHDLMLAALGDIWSAGIAVNWQTYHAGTDRSRVSLPTYPFERQRHWIDAPEGVVVQTATAEPSLETKPHQDSAMTVQTCADASVPSTDLVGRVAAVFEDLFGRKFDAKDHATTFIELGFDSLLLTQAAQSLQTTFGIQIRFRQLFNEIACVDDVARHIAAAKPELATPAPVAATPIVAEPASREPVVSVVKIDAHQGSLNGLGTLMKEQLETMSRLMERQLQVVNGLSIPSDIIVPEVKSATTQPVAPVAPVPPSVAANDENASPVRFRPLQKGRTADVLTDEQRGHITRLIDRYVQQTPRSKQLAAAHRSVLADPRTVSGFAIDWKEMVYPIVAARAKGARIWDVDGNSYIDLVNGYGQTAFGHAPDFVVEAVQAQLSQGFAIGPQSPLALEAAARFCELTGHARVAFCNTGSEAVMAALRTARTVTGRDRVVTFGGAYHGQFDEVLARSVGSGEGRRTIPGSPGVPADAVGRLTVLDYGTDQSLAWIRQHAHELAAVLVEPVQSRRPGFLPVEFLRELRRITEASKTALIFDEVVTGFRVHPAGIQALVGIRPDLATYGKVVGGGLPIGLLAGVPAFMDALDGGQWQFGDDSVPEVGVTFFAGTFVRHPLALAAMVAVLKHVKEKGLALNEDLTSRMERLAAGLRAAFAEVGWEVPIESYGSLLYFEPGHDHRLGSLLPYHLRTRGIFMQEHYPCFLTTEHGDAEIEAIVSAVRDSLQEMRRDGVLPNRLPSAVTAAAAAQTPARRSQLSLPLTEAQLEIWLSAQSGSEASAAFNEAVSVTLDGAIDTARLANAVKQVVDRHPVLRATFSEDGATMTIASDGNFPITIVDMGGSPDPKAGLEALIEARAAQPYDLVKGPVAEAQIVRMSDDRHVLIVSAHHIVCDGWSTNVLLNEIATAYRGEAQSLPAPTPFAAYAARNRTGDQIAASQSYWTKAFADIPAVLELPTDHVRPSQRSFNGGNRVCFIDAELYRRVKLAAAGSRSTLFTTLFSAFQVLLFKLSGHRDLVIGVPAAGQSVEEGGPLVGHCVNFLPIRGHVDPTQSFAQHLNETGRIILDAYDHQNCTLGTLLKSLQIPPVPGRLPLVEVQFNLERLGDNLDFGARVSASVEPNPKLFSTFDLYLNLVESNEGLRGDCCYNADLFDAETIDRWLGHFRTLLAAFAARPDTTIKAMPLLEEREHRHILSSLNNVQASPSNEQLDVIAAFEAQARQHPDAIAVTLGEENISYDALNAWSDRIASDLRARETDRESRVAVLIERSPALVAALLGTLKAGWAYVPLDASMPKRRIRTILKDSGCVAILTAGPLDADLLDPKVESNLINVNATNHKAVEAGTGQPDPGSLAYVIYTSGSTGAPKGVEVTRGGLSNLLAAMAREPGLSRSDTLLAVTTITFDIAALELFLPLVQGARVVIASSETTKDGMELLALLKQCRSTVMQATPMTWRLLLDAGFQSHPGFRMLCGGERLPLELARKLLEGGGELWNMYGPTETTIWSSVSRISSDDETITIGRPIANTQFHIVDAYNQPVPVGVPGELLIAGAGVARGYAGNPRLTAASFIENPLESAATGKVYRTGDSARHLPDGRVQLLGRLDEQVKLRGFRIEPGEIEAVLARKAGVVSTVILRQDIENEPRLACYYVPPIGGEAPSAGELRSLLAEDLPEYMVPTAWVSLSAFPLTSSGKIDRAALPTPDMDVQQPKAAQVEPRTALEQKLHRIWCEVLRSENIGVEDDLLELGADSLRIFQITSRARREGLKVTARDLFRNRTIAGLAAALTETGVDVPPAPSQRSWKRPWRRTPAVNGQADPVSSEVVLQREQR